MTLSAGQRWLLVWLAGAVLVVGLAYVVARSSSDDGDSVATAGTLPELTTSTSTEATTTSDASARSTTTTFQQVRAAPSGVPAEADPPPTRRSSTTTTTLREASPTTSATARTTGAAVPPFQASISGVTAEDLGASWRPEIAGCARPEELRMLHVSHWGYDGEVHAGRIVVHATHAEAIVGVFAALYDARFPIERMEPVSAYGGDDGASMRANNTSGYNCRHVAGTGRVSEHALGQAIDVNPLHNPYVKPDGTVDPPEGARWADRSLDEPGMVKAGDAAVRAFEAAGWHWGGAWRSGQDLQHFSAGGR